MTDPATSGPDSTPPDVPLPRLLCDIRALTGQAPESAGAVWRLAESGRQLDANLIRLPARHRVDSHTEPDLDVLLLVLGGDGILDSPDGPRRLAEGTLLWLPRGSTRGVTAGEDGLSYLTVHQRRPGMQIRHRTG